MFKKISMVALLISVCTAASAVSPFNKSVDAKFKNTVISTSEKTTKTNDSGKSCDCDSGLKEKVANLEIKMSDTYKSIETMKKDNPDTGTIQKNMDAMKEDFNSQIKSIKDSLELVNKKINELQKK
jgi:hypothetical protein